VTHTYSDGPRSGQRRGAARRDGVRAEKRAQFEGPRRRNRPSLILGVVVVVAVAALVGFVVLGRGGSSGEVAPVQNGKIVLSAAQFRGGTARFYAYDAGGIRVKFFVVTDTKGKIHVALDACEVCFPKKLGYKQAGDFIQCNNCGKKFLTDKLNRETGGCNPVPVQSSVIGGDVVISATDLDSGVKYFQ
jgi:uncharacterized membrane protein